ncbi:type II toxin-antitoxin system PemK/MazF family toxin [Aquisphaera giovannonii]|uniref:type II toxin-antitoxin system PemK/MazF family toxin n=1 Tax=Aquisphaera giovannonii TaxID=406548 RepID=UPI0011DF0237
MSTPASPDRGHLDWLTLDPQAGHEQAGRRPALVLSPASYNQAVGLALFCPVTRQGQAARPSVLSHRSRGPQRSAG